MKKVVVTRPSPEAAIDRLREHFEVEVLAEGEAERPGVLKRAFESCDAAFVLITETIGRELFEAAPRLEIVANMAVGYNNIDVAAAREHGVVVTNTPDVLTETTADLAWALILGVARRVVESDRFLREGRFDRWGPLMLLGTDVHGKRLGIVGMGRIGEAVARRGRLGFGMEVTYWSRSACPRAEAELDAARVSLDELLERSDVVSVHVPLVPETHHLIGVRELQRMKSSAILINTARGPIVDEAALAAALEDGVIRGAGLDVFEEEPKVHPGLLQRDDVVLLPHIGSASLETRTRMANLAADNILAVLGGGEPLTPVS